MNKIYKAPDSEATDCVESPALASRISRWGAAMIDSLVLIVLLLPLMYGIGYYDYLETPDRIPWWMELVAGLSGAALYLLLNGHLLISQGQTIGKKLTGIRIVTLDNKLPAVSHYAKRLGFSWGVSYIPVVGGILALIQVLLIFGEDHRCGHDYVAGTKVIKK